MQGGELTTKRRVRWGRVGGGNEQRREENNGERLSTSRPCLSDHKTVHWCSAAPHRQQTFQLSPKRNNSTPRRNNNSFGLHLNHHYWQLKLSSNWGPTHRPIYQIKVNSRTSLIEASSSTVSNGHTTGTTGRPAFLIERSPTVARGREGNDL